MRKALKKYSNKTKAAFILLIIMILILFSNFNTLRNSKKANENINTIYNDRLVVAYYIFQYANEIHFIRSEVQKANLKSNYKSNQIRKSLEIIHDIDDLYVKTVLTPKEKTQFNAFLASCFKIEKDAKNEDWNLLLQSSNEALKTLNNLSEIQIKEGKTQLASANAMHNDNNSLGQLQISLLIVLGGITFYLLIIKKRKTTIKIPEPPSLN